VGCRDCEGCAGHRADWNTTRAETVVLCWSKPVVDDYSKNSNAGDSLNVQTWRRQLLCTDTSSSSGEHNFFGLGTIKSQIVVREHWHRTTICDLIVPSPKKLCPPLNVFFPGVASQYWRPERLGMCHRHI